MKENKEMNDEFCGGSFANCLTSCDYGIISRMLVKIKEANYAL